MAISRDIFYDIVKTNNRNYISLRAYICLKPNSISKNKIKLVLVLL